MNRLLRVLTALALAVGGSLMTAGAATATPQDLTACDEQAAGYSPGSPCQLIVDAGTECVNDVPWVTYSAVAEGTTATTATITFVNPEGDDIVLTDQPLSGKLLWPGATVDEDGFPTDWPGWTLLPNGEWVESDEYDWAIPELTLRFEVNPVADAVVIYPVATPVCTLHPTGGASSAGVTQVSTKTATAAAAAAQSRVLSATGTTVTPLLMVAGGLVVAGLGTALVARRRQTTQH